MKWNLKWRRKKKVLGDWRLAPKKCPEPGWYLGLCQDHVGALRVDEKKRVWDEDGWCLWDRILHHYKYIQGPIDIDVEDDWTKWQAL
jgi:hypothetical protein